MPTNPFDTSWSYATSMALVLASVAACSDDSSATTTTTSASSTGAGGASCMIDTTYNPDITPANFAAAVNNPLFPLDPGTTFTYSEGDATVTVVVKSETKDILGVTCTVVQDTVKDTASGDLIEDTTDWYAQDMMGAVWYMGEDTAEYANGMVTTREGSWEAGVDGAKPGVIIPANPAVGDKYRQEYYGCHAEDYGEVLSLDEMAMTPFGSWTGCMQTHDYTPLAPEVNEQKFYCPDVGLVLSIDVPTGDREELTDKTP